MPKIIIHDTIHSKALDFLSEQEGLEIIFVDADDRSKLLANLLDAEAIILRYLPFDRECIEASKRLNVISRHGVGYDNIDMESANMFSIPVATIGDVNSVTVAELTIYLILSSAKQGPRHNMAVREGNWKIRESADAFDLAGKNVLVLGFGRIGKKVAKRIQSFETKVFVCDPYISQDLIKDAGYIPVPKYADILHNMDIVTIHVPLNPETELMINKNFVNKMKKGSVLVNTARGPIVDTSSVGEALVSGKLFSVACDVFDPEPPYNNNPILNSPRSILTPHVGGLTQECSIRSALRAAENALAGVKGVLDKKFLVNPQVLNK